MSFTNVQHPGSMSSAPNSQESNHSLQEIGAQFETNPTKASRTQDVNLDPQKLIADNKAEGKKASPNSVKTSGKAKGHGDVSININRSTTSLNKSTIAGTINNRTQQHERPLKNSNGMQRWGSGSICDEPWSNVEQAKAGGGPKTTSSSDVVSSKSASTPATKGSLEPTQRR